MNKVILSVIKAEIKNDGKYLIIKKSPTAHIFPNHWDFPGGKMEPSEDEISTLKREALEETGLIIEPIEKAHEFDETGFSTKYGNILARITVWEAKLISGTPVLSEAHTEYRWASKEDILSLALEPYLRDYLEKI